MAPEMMAHESEANNKETVGNGIWLTVNSLRLQMVILFCVPLELLLVNCKVFSH